MGSLVKTEPSFQTLKIQNQSQARPINPASKKPTIGSATLAPTSQPDSITSQLNNGVRGLRLNLYDFEDDVWLCHSFGGHRRLGLMVHFPPPFPHLDQTFHLDLHWPESGI
ncbi:hypothetical protein KIW84_041644 [Lathyrus oleraceus]|uniref:Uncharacterized protein n=1 Tax=Pisum sativum TaxID=3888 RepID=A0A9D5ARF9_PEA|nr:hypothetical protein KIW84_041642 [Pisum sativum]KAI5416693.1 hypothetical protein KIW84_041644 [Pisum sativum]